jgi:hypothetical protein
MPYLVFVNAENPPSTDLYGVKGGSKKPINQMFGGKVHGHRYAKVI